MISFNIATLDIAFLFATVLVVTGALLLIMVCIWRAEGKFDKYLKLIAFALILLLLKNVLLLFGFRSYEYWSISLRILDFFQVLFFLFSNIELFIIIRSLSGEDKVEE